MPGGEENKQLVVVIDVGHGIVPKAVSRTGWDDGAIKTVTVDGKKQKITEYEFNVQNANLLKEELESRGYKVILTTDPGERDTSNLGPKDNFTSRFEVAKKHEADLYISIHANSNPVRSLSGTVVYLASNSCEKSNEAAEKIIISLHANDRNIEHDVQTLIKDRDGPLARLAEITNKKTPGFLVEVEYMTNKQGLECLMDAQHCQTIAIGVADGIDSFFGMIPGRLQQQARETATPARMDSLHIDPDSLIQEPDALRVADRSLLLKR